MYPLLPLHPSDTLQANLTLKRSSTVAPYTSTETPAPIGLAVEESGFSRNLSPIRPRTSAFGVPLHLAEAHTTRTPQAIPFRLLSSHNPSLSSMSPRQKAAALVLVAGLLGWGYVTVRRSVTTVREAWRVTDTATAQRLTQPKRYLFENAEIPGPYQSGAPLWQALREHLGSPSPSSPVRRPVL